MTGFLNLLIGLAMGLNLLALGSSRLPSLIRTMSLQEWCWGVMPLLLEDFNWQVGLIALATMAGKGLIIPRSCIGRCGRQYMNVSSTLLSALCRHCCSGQLVQSAQWPWRGRCRCCLEHAGSQLVPGALASVLTGFLFCSSGGPRPLRRSAGYLILETVSTCLGCCSSIRRRCWWRPASPRSDRGRGFVIGIIVDRIQRAC